jgi:hypothetical protein
MIASNDSTLRSSFLRGAASAALLVGATWATAAPAAGISPVLLAAAAHVTVYATGFNNPRGLKFGPDGKLYVAEGGPGGTNSTVGECTQVPAPIGPYTGSQTGGRISRVSSNGVRTTVTNKFPSSQTAATQGSLVSGVADIAFIGDDLYAITAGGGCSHGVRHFPNGIYRVHSDGSTSLIANLSAWQKAHPVAAPEADDFEPDGTWYSMKAINGALYAVEPNHGELVRVTESGDIHRVADISATQGHIVPTAFAFRDDDFYVGNLNTFPISTGSSKIIHIEKGGGYVHPVVWGLTTVVGVAFHNNHMYVLENTVGEQFPTPGHGDIVRVSASGQKTVVVSGLALPTAMTFGPDGAIYVSNLGFGPPPSLPNGPGQVLRITDY